MGLWINDDPAVSIVGSVRYYRPRKQQITDTSTSDQMYLIAAPINRNCNCGT